MFKTTSLFKICLIPLFIIALLAPWSGWIDLKISHYFYENNTFQNDAFYRFIYVYGVWPAWISLITFIVGAFFWKSWRKPALYLILTMAIGSGLIIHLGLKDNWGRPRPRQVEEFGGTETFRPFYSPQAANGKGPFKSFSCGHCSVGFYFFSFAFLGLYFDSRKLYWLGLILGWGLGIALSWTRIAQGGHFFFDTLISCLIMWWVAYGLNTLILRKEER